MFEMAVPVEPLVVPALHTYEEVRQAMYGVGLHWQEAGIAQLGNMERLSHLVTTTIIRRAGEGFARFIISTPASPEESDHPQLNHMELWPGQELRLYFSDDPNAYTIEGRCRTIQDLASIGTWYLLATQRLNESFTPHNAQAAYNAAISRWNDGMSQRRIMQQGTEAALLGLFRGTVIYQAAAAGADQEAAERPYLINKVTIHWGRGVERCLSTWQ
ncbi:MAG: hypothetical protein IBX50_05005 [Marinospirillum sp.]|uniref:hypothetical protein n=1 Tax=Marinospirillum sp. TaxID=2183934 RepID=UPI0019FFB7DA|nr:hypothetical protein [Marinospirillum sp.]MBE0506066.1 hypothetical protein [Marinospirillum sp.]